MITVDYLKGIFNSIFGWLLLARPPLPSQRELDTFEVAVGQRSHGHITQQRELRNIYIGFALVALLVPSLPANPVLVLPIILAVLALLILVRMFRAIDMRIQTSKEAFGTESVQGGWSKGILMSLVLVAPVGWLAALSIMQLMMIKVSTPMWLPYYVAPMLLWWIVAPVNGDYDVRRAIECAHNRSWWRTLMIGAPVLKDETVWSKRQNRENQQQQTRQDNRQNQRPQVRETNNEDVEGEKIQEESKRAGGAKPIAFKSQNPLSWNDLVLPDKTLEQIQTTLAVLTDPQKRKLVPSPPRGLLLWGPPGNGKTQIARVIAAVGGFNFYNIGAAEARGAFIGHGAARIKTIFETARENLPAIIFIDELDAIARNRETMSADSGMFTDTVNELLQQMDGLDDRKVFVIGATNYPDSLDPAILRRLGVDPVTFRWAIEIGFPDAQCRSRLLRLFLKGVPLERGIDMTHIVNMTDGMSGDSLKTLCTMAGIEAIKKGHKKLTEEDFLSAVGDRVYQRSG